MKLQYLIFIPLIMLAVGKVLLQSMISRNYLKNVTDSILYNILVFGGMCGLYLILNGFHLPTRQIVIMGIGYGVMYTAFQLCYTMALQRGLVSHTALIISFNNLFTIAFGLLYCDETLHPLNVVGIVCMFLSIILTVDFKQAKAHKFDLVWFLLSLAGMAANGIASIIIKVQKMNYPNDNTSMLLVSYLVGTLILILAYKYLSVVKKKPRAMLLNKTRLTLMFSVSVILGFYLLLYSIGVGMIPAVVFFPIVNIAPTTMISLFGIFIFKDNLSSQQKVSLFFGIASTLLLCI